MSFCPCHKVLELINMRTKRLTATHVIKSETHASWVKLLCLVSIKMFKCYFLVIICGEKSKLGYGTWWAVVSSNWHMRTSQNNISQDSPITRVRVNRRELPTNDFNSVDYSIETRRYVIHRIKKRTKALGPMTLQVPERAHKGHRHKLHFDQYMFHPPLLSVCDLL